MRKTIALILIIGISAAHASTFHYDEQRTGNFTTIGPKKAELVYKVQLTGFIDGSPVVWNGNVYVMNNPGFGSAKLGLYCINATNGSVVWRISGIYGMATPSVGSGYVFVHAYDNSTHSGKLYCFYAENGTERWNVTLETGLGWWYISSSPILYNNSVYILSYDGILHSFYANNGTEKWNISSAGINRKYFSSPSAFNGLIVYPRNESGTYYLTAVNETGRMVWKARVNGTITNTPAIANGKVYIATDKKLYAFNLNGSEVWNRSFSGSISTPAIANGMLYIGSKDGKLYSFYANNGTERWNYTAILNPTAFDSIQSSPAYSDGVVYFATNEQNGKIIAINTSGKPLWIYNVSQYVMSSPFVYRNKLYIGADDGNLYIFGIWKGSITLTPGKFNITADNGKTYAVPNFTALGALQKASEVGGFSYTVNAYGGGNLYPTSIGGINNGYWCYEVNGISPMNGTNRYNVSDGDRVVYWLWTNMNDSTSNAPNIVIIDIHAIKAEINNVSAGNGHRGGWINATVNLTSYVNDWLVIDISGTNKNGDSIAGISTVKMNAGERKEVPVIIPVPLQAQTGNYKLYTAIYRLDDYPEHPISYTTTPAVCNVT